MKWLITAIIIALVLLVPTNPARAADKESVVVTATPDVGLGIISFIATVVSDTQVDLEWTYDDNIINVMVRAKYSEMPASRTEGYFVYEGDELSCSDTSMDLDETATKLYYRIWAQTDGLVWLDSDVDVQETEGIGMTLLALVILAVGLTAAMFITKQAMLGFPSTIMWAILGVFAYTESATAWGDWQFYLAFASLLGMTTFCALGAYGLREKRDTIADREIEHGESRRIGEEGSEKEHGISEGKYDIFADNEEDELSGWNKDRDEARRNRARKRRQSFEQRLSRRSRGL